MPQYRIYGPDTQHLLRPGVRGWRFTYLENAQRVVGQLNSGMQPNECSWLNDEGDEIVIGSGAGFNDFFVTAAPIPDYLQPWMP